VEGAKNEREYEKKAFMLVFHLIKQKDMCMHFLLDFSKKEELVAVCVVLCLLYQKKFDRLFLCVDFWLYVCLCV